MGRSSQVSHRDMQEQERRKGQAWWGIAGLVLILAYGGISYVLSVPLAESTRNLVAGMPVGTWRIFVGVGIFVGLLAISGIIYSLFVPKREVKFSERELDKDRKAVQYEAMMKKERQKQVRKQMAKARREGK